MLMFIWATVNLMHSRVILRTDTGVSAGTMFWARKRTHEIRLQPTFGYGRMVVWVVRMGMVRMIR